MKKVLIFISLVFLFAAANAQQKNTVTKTIYTCPMHPEIKRDKPGSCPICGMNLVKKTVTTTVAKAMVKKQNKPATPKKVALDSPKKSAAAVRPGTTEKDLNETVNEMKEAVEELKASVSELKEIVQELRPGNVMPMSRATDSSSNTQIYSCPMHSDVKSDKPGNCPRCGMQLIAQKVQMGHSASAIYTCPMHPEIQSSKPGNCPKCGMKLVIDKTKGPPDKDVYSCPMHPEITSDKPGKCPKCGMNLVKENHSASLDESSLAEKIREAKLKLGDIKTVVNRAPPRTVVYHLYIRDTTVSFGKKKKRAIAVNGQIPMPTLTFTEGDTAEIWVHNQLNELTSLHWHGLFLPNKMDGVPYLTQMPIKPGATYLYKFPIVQHGTHWYHSHSGLQEQIGMYGAFIMNKREEWDIPTIPLVISEWTDMKPEEVHRSLHAATDWFAIQKGATQSYSEAISQGRFKTKLVNEWKRMTAMDLTDVYYDNFLINGKNQSEYSQFKTGDKVRLRIANAGASDYFWLSYSGGKITVVATDGNDVEPIEVDRLIIAVSETYDVVLTIPDNKSYEFLVTPEDRIKYASVWFGSGEKVPAMKLQRPKYFAGMQMMNDMMDMNGNLVEMKGMRMQNQVMDMNTVVYPEITGPEDRKGDGAAGMDHDQHNMSQSGTGIVSLNYEMLRAPQKTSLPEGPWKELKFDLTGNMNRYVWSMDNKVISERDKILIKKGENVRIIMFNNSMMRHPMHLHGHDFRLLNGQGENAILKNIIDIMPMERDTIEFNANERGGDWFFHCHILYHMMSGMGAVFSYDNTLADKTDITNPKLAWRKLGADDRKFHLMGSVGLESNGSDGELMLANTRYRISTEWRLGLKDHHGYESETYFGKYLGRMQWWFPFIGFDYHKNDVMNEAEKNLFGQRSNQNNRKAIVAGLQYTLPMLLIAEGRIDSKGKVRFQLMREDIPVSPRLRLNVMGNTDKEYMAGVRYIVTKYFGVSTHYDSDMGVGAGITFNY